MQSLDQQIISQKKHRMSRATILRQSENLTPALLVMLETFRRSGSYTHTLRDSANSPLWDFYRDQIPICQRVKTNLM